jgi:hypothetical protein
VTERSEGTMDTLFGEAPCAEPVTSAPCAAAAGSRQHPDSAKDS